MLGTENEGITSEANGKYNYNFAYNLLHEVIPDDRTCEHIAKEKCICE